MRHQDEAAEMIRERIDGDVREAVGRVRERVSVDRVQVEGE